MNQKINYNFFQIIPRKTSNITAQEISDYLRTLKNMSEFKTQELSGSFLFIYEISVKEDIIIGTIILGRTSNLAGNVDRETKKVIRLGLEETQGLEKHSTFIIDIKANILVLESNGVSTRLLLNYLTEVTSLPKTEVSVLINPSEIQKFFNMHTITKFTVKVAKVENGNIFKDAQNSSIGQVIKSADETNSDELTYSIKVDRKNNHQKSLFKEKIVNFVKDFLTFKETEEVKELKITGEYNDDFGSTKFTPIDLIHERLNDFIEIEKDPRDSTVFKIDEKYKKLEKLYSKHRHDVTSTYKII